MYLLEDVFPLTEKNLGSPWLPYFHVGGKEFHHFSMVVSGSRKRW